MKVVVTILVILLSGCVNNPDRSGISAHVKLSIAEVTFLPTIDLGLDISTSRGVTENAKITGIIGRDWGLLRLCYC